jgi:hypothetical protein
MTTDEVDRVVHEVKIDFYDEDFDIQPFLFSVVWTTNVTHHHLIIMNFPNHVAR